MPNEQIGIIIWGCKGGHRVFCSNDVVDHRDPVIKDTLKDIRSFVRFNQNKINSFALEFTDRYKIYTIYRSCNDNGTGAYVAIIVYVPHSLCIPNIRPVLTKMMDKYFEDYVHPLYGTYIPGKYDDIKPFSLMFNAEAQIRPESRRSRVLPSTQDNTPSLRLYADVAEVDEFFSSPYRPEFFTCQEVMFLDKTIYDRIPETLKFQNPPRLIERVSPPEPLPALDLGSHASAVTAFTVNGQAKDPRDKVELNVTDNIELVLSKAYHEDYRLSGTVGELERAGRMVERGKVISLVGVNYQPRTYTIKVLNNGQPAPDGLLKVWMAKGREADVMRGEIQVSGADVRTQLHWAVRATADGGWIESREILFPYEYIDTDKPMDLATVAWPFTVQAGDVRSGELTVKLDRKLSLRFRFTGGRTDTISITTPKGDYTRENFSFSADNALVRENGGTVTIEPMPKEYRVEVQNVKRFWDSWDWSFDIDGHECRKGDDTVCIPAGMKIGDGRLTINNLPFQFTLNGDVIYPYAVLVKTSTMVGVDFRGQTYDVSQRALFPDQPLPAIVASDQYEVEKVPGQYVQQFIVSPKGINLRKDTDPRHGDTPAQPKEVHFTFYNCKGQAFDAGGKDKIKSDTEEVTLSRNSMLTLYIKGTPRCTVFKDASKYQPNEQDYDVKYSKDGIRCEVTYKGPKVGGLSKNVIIISSVVAATLAVAACAFFLLPWSDWFGKNANVPVCKISFVPDTDSYYFADRNATIGKLTPESPLFTVKEDSILEVNFDSKYLKKECEGKIGTYVEKVMKAVVDLKIDGIDLSTYPLESAKISNDLTKQLTDYKAVFEGKQKQAAVTSIYIPVVSPIRDAVRSFEQEQAASDKEILFSRAADVIHQYPAAAKAVMEICWKRMETDHTIANIEAFKSTFSSVPGYADYSAQLELWIAEINNAVAQEAAKDALLNLAKTHRAQLQAKSCTKNTVNNINNWWQTLAPSDREVCTKNGLDLGAYVAAYNKFFAATSVDDMNKLSKNYKSYFSNYQQNVIKSFYGENKRKFQQRKNAYGMTFNLPDTEVKPDGTRK